MQKISEKNKITHTAWNSIYLECSSFVEDYDAMKISILETIGETIWYKVLPACDLVPLMESELLKRLGTHDE